MLTAIKSFFVSPSVSVASNQKACLIFKQALVKGVPEKGWEVGQQ